MPRWTKNPAWWAFVLSLLTALMLFMSAFGGYTSAQGNSNATIRAEIEHLKEAISKATKAQESDLAERESIRRELIEINKMLFWMMGKLNGGELPSEFSSKR